MAIALHRMKQPAADLAVHVPGQPFELARRQELTYLCDASLSEFPPNDREQGQGTATARDLRRVRRESDQLALRLARSRELDDLLTQIENHPHQVLQPDGAASRTGNRDRRRGGRRRGRRSAPGPIVVLDRSPLPSRGESRPSTPGERFRSITGPNCSAIRSIASCSRFVRHLSPPSLNITVSSPPRGSVSSRERTLTLPTGQRQLGSPLHRRARVNHAVVGSSVIIV